MHDPDRHGRRPNLARHVQKAAHMNGASPSYRPAIQQLMEHIESLVRLHRGRQGTVTITVADADALTVLGELRQRMHERGLGHVRLLAVSRAGTPRVASYEFEP
jgi:hypothetical protein